MRQDCVNANNDCRSCVNCSMFESIYKPIDYWWKHYDELRLYPELKSKQGTLTQGTFLCEGGGIEYSFIPTKVMFDTETVLIELYKNIHTVDHKVALCNEVFYTSKIEGANSTLLATDRKSVV